MVVFRKWTQSIFVLFSGGFIIFLTAAAAWADGDSEVESFMHHYLNTFDTGHIWEITPLYSDPFYMLAPSGGIKSFEGARGIKKSIKDWKFYMKKAGVATSRYIQLNVKALSEDTALASTEVERADEHGKVRANTGATYTLVRVDGQWKIYLIHLHSRETVFNFQ
jgi:ketosteroid isomerase-like protein